MKNNTQESNEKIQKLLFKQVKKPKNVHEVRIANVFDNRYRINVWITVEEDNLTKRKIGASYFAHFDGDNLKITDGIKE